MKYFVFMVVLLVGIVSSLNAQKLTKINPTSITDSVVAIPPRPNAIVLTYH